MTEAARPWKGRPAEVWALVVMDLSSALLSTVGAVFPATPASPARLNAVVAVLSLLFSVTLWSSGHRPRRWLLHTNCLAHLLTTSLLVAEAATGEGALSIAVTYLLITWYSAAFFRRSILRGYVAVSATGLGLGLVANEVLVARFAAWLPMVVAAVVSSEVLSWLLARMRGMALTDPLTGVLNRAGFQQAAERMLAAQQRTGDPLTIAVIDLDEFKAVNDRDGHAAGDAWLARVAEEWREGVRTTDLVARHGGDEFVLLLTADEPQADRLMRRLREESSLGWSYGLSPVRSGGDLDACLRHADRRMYAAKAAAVASRGGERDGAGAEDVEDIEERRAVPGRARG